jgi:predicted nucleic acid-binding protein
MGGIKICISDELERRFREVAMRLYGYGRGSLSIASEKAPSARLQVSEALNIAGPIEDPVEAIYGMLSHVKRRGVDLQHGADIIVSYDDDFDSVAWVKRRTPEDLL